MELLSKALDQFPNRWALTEGLTPCDDQDGSAGMTFDHTGQLFNHPMELTLLPSLCVLGITGWALDIASSQSQKDCRQSRKGTLSLDRWEHLDVFKTERIEPSGFRLLLVRRGLHLGHFLGKWQSS